MAAARKTLNRFAGTQVRSYRCCQEKRVVMVGGGASRGALDLPALAVIGDAGKRAAAAVLHGHQPILGIVDGYGSDRST
jgi:hypothetical protein